MPLLIEVGVSGLCIQVWACAAGGAWGGRGASSGNCHCRYSLLTRNSVGADSGPALGVAASAALGARCCVSLECPCVPFVRELTSSRADQLDKPSPSSNPHPRQSSCHFSCGRGIYAGPGTGGAKGLQPEVRPGQRLI